MRKIKFRALAVVNDKRNGIKIGDFVYGSYIDSGVDAPCIIFGDGEQIEIDRKTLGQFTGWADKNDVELYEGDIVGGYIDVIGDPVEKNRLMTSEINWATDNSWAGMSDGCIVRHQGFRLTEYYFKLKDCEVVGNAHQNPELVYKSDWKGKS